ncbi:PLU-1-like protein-domain-containing protein [Podospora didyma]|uniref:PLU-1-like protein-domain-containing protein n=1 Tax=Podospora didyma TaxID=330526 RepID=A0AAE0KJC3_9PEZI|nr:PLU-1-like protein-domain-containing protein [Podospora didyma]
MGGGMKPKPAQVYSNGYHPTKPQNPLSSMRSAPLDLSSVERRGQPTASKEPVTKRTRPHGLEEAPSYCPTEEEWKEPFEYIQKISAEAQHFGICKIIPPPSWNPDFAIDTEKFHFRTRKQELNSVEGSTRANLTYIDALGKFHKQQGSNLTRWPFVDKKPLDLYRLKKAVEARGGFEKVCKLKKWAEIGRDLGYSGKIMSSLSTSLKNSYQKWLCPYEDYLRIAKPGVHQQLELEYGGPLTPSPAPSPMKRSNANTPSGPLAGSPARHATDALQATMNNHPGDADRDISMTDASPLAPPVSSGFTAINSGGGFTAVNSAASASVGFRSANRPLAPAPAPGTPPVSSSKSTPDYRPSGLGPAATKRQLSVESLDPGNKDCGTDKEDGDAGSRRSKRLKKDAVPTVAGSHMSLFRPSAPRIPKDETLAPGEKCEQCGKGKEDNSFLLVCESCDHGYHGACLDPPIKIKPDVEWNCPRCLVGDGQFGFEEGGLYSLKQFQEKAGEFKQGYFENKMPFDPVLNCHRPVTEDDVEQEFWRLVADLEETVEVEYGADIHCTTHGSGFPTAEKNPNNPYATDPWNLNLLPLHPDSLFRHIKSDISGMTVPWVYVGMIFSTFCWHNEDHYAYSANYQHFGATKTWYGIPGEDAEKFENAMREAVPELFETQPDLLFQLVTLLTPEQLKKAGVRVYALDQRAGQFVITFPQAYHAGFNHGFNFNEAVNFAPADWEPYGLAGVERMQQFRRQPCFSHDELLWTAAEGTTSAGAGLTIQTAKWLAPALDRIHQREVALRRLFVDRHHFVADVKTHGRHHRCVFNGKADVECAMTFKIDDVDVPEEEYACFYCKAFTYLSRFVCLKTGKVLCLQHAGSHPCCDMQELDRIAGKDHALYYRKSDEALSTVYKKVADKAHLPEAWEEKYEKLLDEEATPSLRTLRNLLSEGEKIPYELPSLRLLKMFVDRCNHWVEEATNYTVRKQQVRRKNEKGGQSGARKSVGSSAQDQKEREMRNVDNVYRLLDEAEQIGFDCPEILQLKERAEAIKTFIYNAKQVLSQRTTENPQNLEVVEELFEEGQSFNVDIPEVERLSAVLDQLRWNDKAKGKRGCFVTLKDVQELIEEGETLKIPIYNDHLAFFKSQMDSGQLWEKTAQDLIRAENLNYSQLQALSDQAQAKALPVTPETLAAVDQLLYKQREARKQIMDLNDRSRDPDYRKRPKYAEVLEVIKKIEELQAKPAGTLDLEKEQKRHEDWMRKGKKLFGKSNAPLHILKSHMDYVLDRNFDCFDIVNDKPRVPAEPASREPTPDNTKMLRWADPKFREVFCICRRTEAGMMIECELCHEWYHGKCLKIARGKVKEDDKYTCPICDWRVKIPRDAARPKLEDLISWYEEVPGLPFQAEEEEVLKKIIANAQDFRNHIAAYCNSIVATGNEAETQRFYLRKIEGAEILLAFETNFLRQELHKWSPVAPEPPPVLESSKSTRKPRPTKLQKMLAQYGVDDPDDLPESVKGKANSLKRKQLNAEAAAMASGGHMATSPGANPYGAPGGSFFSRHSSDQPQTPGLSMGSGPHAHHSHGPESSSSRHGRSDSNTTTMDLDSGAIHPSFFMGNGIGVQQLLITDNNSTHMLEERLLHGGYHDGGEDGLNMNLNTEAGKARALEIFSRTEVGRRRAEELYGRDVWGGASAADDNDPIGIGPGAEGDVGDSSIFADLMIDEDDDDRNKGHGDSHVMIDEERNEAASLMDAQA